MNSKKTVIGVEFPHKSISGGIFTHEYTSHNRVSSPNHSVYYGINSRFRNESKSSKRHTFFRIFPPIRFFLDATKAIEKLRLLNETVLDENGNEIKNAKAGVLRPEDTGFNEIVKVVKDNNNINYGIEEIVFQEQNMDVVLNWSPGIETVLQFRDDKGNEIIKISDPFDPGKPIRELKSWVEEMFRRKIAYWTLIMIVVWLIANTYLLVSSTIS